MVVRSINNKIATIANKATKVNSELDLNPDAIRLEIKKTGSFKIAASTYDDSNVIFRTPTNIITSSTNAEFNATAGDVVYVYLENNNWETLKQLDLQYMAVGAWGIDVLREKHRLANLEILRLKYVSITNAVYENIVSPHLLQLDLQNSPSTTNWVGDIAAFSHVSQYLSLYGHSNASGSIESINPFLNQLFLYGDNIIGDGSHLLNFNMTQKCYFNLPNVDFECSDFANIYTVMIYQADNLAGDLSDFLKNIALQIPVGLQDALNATGTIDVFSNAEGLVYANYINCPKIAGDLSSISKLTARVRIIGTNIYTYTTSPTGMASIEIHWYNSITPIAQDDLLRLLADKVTYAESHNQLNGKMYIGGNNAAITDSQGLADIVALESLGWTIIYNT